MRVIDGRRYFRDARTGELIEDESCTRPPAVGVQPILPVVTQLPPAPVRHDHFTMNSLPRPS